MENSAKERMIAQTIFASRSIRLGRFESSPQAADFCRPAPPGHYVVAFPETEVVIDYARSGPTVVDTTTATFHDPDEQYLREKISAEGDRCCWLSASEDVLNRLFRGDRSAGEIFRFGLPVLPLSTNLFSRQRLLFKQLSSYAGNPGPIEEEALGLLSELATTVTMPREPVPQRFTRRLRPPVEAALRFVASAPEEARSLQEVAYNSGCSAHHLCHLFREQTGQTIQGYRNSLRLRRGFDQLIAGHKVSAVAARQGFSTHSQFSTSFRREFGAQPSSIRRSLNGSFGRLPWLASQNESTGRTLDQHSSGDRGVCAPQTLRG